MRSPELGSWGKLFIFENIKDRYEQGKKFVYIQKQGVMAT